MIKSLCTSKMTSLTLGKIQMWIPLIHVMLLLVGTICSFTASIVQGDISLYLPFISETGAYNPGKSIFSFFLIMGSFIGSFMVVLNYITFSTIQENEIINFSRVNVCSCIIGLVAMIGLAGVAAFPMTTVFWMHLLTATLYFCGSAVYFLSVTLISLKIYGRGHLLISRCVLSAAIMGLLFCIMIMFPISLKNWNDKHSIVPALKEPHQDGFTLLFISSLLEWSIGIVIILFNLTFMLELKKYQIVIGIMPEEYKNEPNVRGRDGNQAPEVAPS